MATNAKLIIGYTDHYGNWIVEKEYVRWMDGYSEAVIPLLKEYTTPDKGVDVQAINDNVEYSSWKFEEIEDCYSIGQMNYHYYIDQSNLAKIRCTVLKEDGEFFDKYGVMNMQVEQELIIGE